MRLPANSRATVSKLPCVTKRELKDAPTIVRPTTWGARERKTVSTSGSSGNGTSTSRYVDQNVLITYHNRILIYC
jgi:hypothetical protein